MELLQLVLGLSNPAIGHGPYDGRPARATLYGHEKLYPQVLFATGLVAPLDVDAVAILVISWVHGCIGLYFWLRMKPFYKRAAPYLLAAAVLIPTLAMLGVYQGGRSVAENDSVEWRAENFKPSGRQVGRKGRAERHHGLSPDRLLGPARIALLARARAPCMSGAAA